MYENDPSRAFVLQSGFEPEHLTATEFNSVLSTNSNIGANALVASQGRLSEKSTQIIERGGRVAEPAVPAERVVVLLRWELAAAVGMGQERVVELAAAGTGAAEEGTELQAEEHTEDSAGTEADNPASAADSPLGLPVAYLGVLPSMQ